MVTGMSADRTAMSDIGLAKGDKPGAMRNGKDLGMRIVDLTLPVTNHFRWPLERGRKGSFAAGDAFEIGWFKTGVHAFTHMDSQKHILPDGFSTDGIALERTVGDAAVIDLALIASNTPVDAVMLEKRASHVEPGDIAVFKSGWDRVHSPFTPEFWTEAPFVTRDGAEWLLARGVSTVAFDFPQDYVIRGTLAGEPPRPLAENVTHDVLLKNGVVLIEYLVNTVELRGPRTRFCALPMKLADSDGAPVRAIAFEDD